MHELERCSVPSTALTPAGLTGEVGNAPRPTPAPSTAASSNTPLWDLPPCPRVASCSVLFAAELPMFAAQLPPDLLAETEACRREERLAKKAATAAKRQRKAAAAAAAATDATAPEAVASSTTRVVKPPPAETPTGRKRRRRA